MTGSDRFAYLAGNTALDYLNTRSVRDGREVELIQTYADLVDWSVGTGRINQSKAGELRGLSSRATRPALQRALHFRNSLKRLVDGLMERGGNEAPLDDLNALLARHEVVRQVRHSPDGGFQLLLNPRPGPDEPWLVALQGTVELLADEEIELIRRCAGPDCILYFLDHTRNHSRRWCSMEVCGNRAKVRAHYRRQRA